METQHHLPDVGEEELHLVQIVPMTPDTPLEREIRRYEATVRNGAGTVVEEAKPDA